MAAGVHEVETEGRTKVLRKWASRIAELLRRGWRAFKEANAAYRLIELSGITVPAGLGTAVLKFYGEHSIAVLTVTCALLLLSFTVMLFLFLGYRNERRLASISSTMTSLTSGGVPDFSTIAARVDPRYMTVADAIRYIADESEWGARIRATLTDRGMRHNPRFAAIDEVVRAAKTGETIIYGRPGRTGEHQIIPPQYWMFATIDHGSVLNPNGIAATSSSAQNLEERQRFTPYDALLIERSEMERIWPRPPHSWMAS
jgi:hypothetical protein